MTTQTNTTRLSMPTTTHPGTATHGDLVKKSATVDDVRWSNSSLLEKDQPASQTGLVNVDDNVGLSLVQQAKGGMSCRDLQHSIVMSEPRAEPMSEMTEKSPELGESQGGSMGNTPGDHVHSSVDVDERDILCEDVFSFPLNHSNNYLNDPVKYSESRAERSLSLSDLDFSSTNVQGHLNDYNYQNAFQTPPADDVVDNKVIPSESKSIENRSVSRFYLLNYKFKTHT